MWVGIILFLVKGVGYAQESVVIPPFPSLEKIAEEIKNQSIKNQATMISLKNEQAALREAVTRYRQACEELKKAIEEKNKEKIEEAWNKIASAWYEEGVAFKTVVSKIASLLAQRGDWMVLIEEAKGAVEQCKEHVDVNMKELEEKIDQLAKEISLLREKVRKLEESGAEGLELWSESAKLSSKLGLFEMLTNLYKTYQGKFPGVLDKRVVGLEIRKAQLKFLYDVMEERLKVYQTVADTLSVTTKILMSMKEIGKIDEAIRQADSTIKDLDKIVSEITGLIDQGLTLFEEWEMEPIPLEIGEVVFTSGPSGIRTKVNVDKLLSRSDECLNRWKEMKKRR